MLCVQRSSHRSCEQCGMQTHEWHSNPRKQVNLWEYMCRHVRRGGNINVYIYPSVFLFSAAKASAQSSAGTTLSRVLAPFFSLTLLPSPSGRFSPGVRSA